MTINFGESEALEVEIFLQEISLAVNISAEYLGKLTYDLIKNDRDI